MTPRINIFKGRPGISPLRLMLLSSLTASAVLIVASATATDAAGQTHAGHLTAPPAKLVEIVRNATRQYIDINAARSANYQPFLGCVSGPDHGAMGIHYVNGPLVGDGEIDATQPEALIYEPSGSGLQLVGVEYIVDAATWLTKHNAPPMLEGQSFQLVTSPNRFGLSSFFELHVWAWRDNPQGSFVDWNNHVTCEGQ